MYLHSKNVHIIQTMLAYTSQANLEPFPKRCSKPCPITILLKYTSKPTPESYKYASKPGPESNTCFQGYYCKWLNIPLHPLTMTCTIRKITMICICTCVLKFLALMLVYCWVNLCCLFHLCNHPCSCSYICIHAFI